jgi:hypothetical protein
MSEITYRGFRRDEIEYPYNIQLIIDKENFQPITDFINWQAFQSSRVVAPAR